MLSAAERSWADERLERILKHEAEEKRRDFIDDGRIEALLEETADPAKEKVRDVLAKARSLAGLKPEEAAILLNNTNEDLWQETYAVAREIKQEIYGNRIVLFAPLYISSPCVNDCIYCGFRHSNPQIQGKTLSWDQLEKEVQALVGKGHKRLIVVYGEHPASDIDFMCESIRRIYAIRKETGEIRRVNVNAAPLFVAEYRQLKQVGIGTFQVFQETYHHGTYARLHPRGTLKHVYTWRLFSLHRAEEAGIDDVAIGALFGLYKWRFEVLGLLYHAEDLEREFGVGPHTISFPRLQPAANTPYATASPYLVSDEELKKIVAVLRCAVPYTGLILTARERPEVRRQVIPLGVSQVDAGSRIAIGGYEEMEHEHIPDREQFQLGDTRSLDDFIRELCEDGYIPSFCTAGYRCGRTGEHFMSLAKKGLVKNFCTPNAVLTFKEYLLDYASPATRRAGEGVIQHYLAALEAGRRRRRPSTNGSSAWRRANVTSTSSRQQSPPSGRSSSPVGALGQIAAQICTRYPIAKAYFAQALGHRLHFLTRAGEETYLPAVKIHIKGDLYLFCEPRRKLGSEVYAQLVQEVKDALELWRGN